MVVRAKAELQYLCHYRCGVCGKVEVGTVHRLKVEDETLEGLKDLINNQAQPYPYGRPFGWSYDGNTFDCGTHCGQYYPTSFRESLKKR